jgi:hypothetical protein
VHKLQEVSTIQPENIPAPRQSGELEKLNPSGELSHPPQPKIKNSYYQIAITNTLLCPPTNHQGAYSGANKKSCKTFHAYQQQQTQSGKLPTHNFNYVFLLFLPLLVDSIQCCLKTKQLIINVLKMVPLL